jgi:hypothetical protein
MQRQKRTRFMALQSVIARYLYVAFGECNAKRMRFMALQSAIARYFICCIRRMQRQTRMRFMALQSTIARCLYVAFGECNAKRMQRH